MGTSKYYYIELFNMVVSEWGIYVCEDEEGDYLDYVYNKDKVKIFFSEEEAERVAIPYIRNDGNYLKYRLELLSE